MVTQTQPQPSNAPAPLTIKDLHTENPRWCVGCGDFGIIMGVKRFMVDHQLAPHQTVNVSGIGCSGRAPNYINAYGVHSIHGRPLTVALGLALARPDLHVFVHAGDGDTLSIGGNHFMHAINKNFKGVMLMYDNELYALTKNQTSPTTRAGHQTMTQPQGSMLDPMNAVRIALGVGGSFIASTADWMQDHMLQTLEAAFKHNGLAFVHISQRCPHFDPDNFDSKTTSWFSFLTHEKGIPPDKRLVEKSEKVEHDPSNIAKAFELASGKRTHFGLFYHNPNKPRYDEIMHNLVKKATPKPRAGILDAYKIT